MTANAQQSLFKEPLFKLYEAQDAIKALKGSIKEIEDDEPMELEDLRLAAKDLKRQIKDKQTEHLKNLAENNSEYNDLREQLQSHKEDLAHVKEEIYKNVRDEKARRGAEIDETVQVQGMPFHLQTQGNTDIFINGKLLK